MRLRFFILASAIAPAAASQQAAPPNVVIILADDLGYGDISCQNLNSKIRTPWIDRLSSEGIRFTDAHSASGVSSPSRYSLLTGRYHWRGHLKTGIISQWGDPAIEEGRMTIAHMLKGKGYQTACIGKWHLGQRWPFKAGLGQNDSSKISWSNISMNGKENWQPDAFDWSVPIKDGPVAKGFDYYFGTGTINFPPYTWIENDRVLEAPTEMLDLGIQKTGEGSWECRPGPAAKGWDITRVPGTLTDKVVEWINGRRGKSEPFFLYYALPSPHAPIIPEDEFRGTSQAGAYGDYVVQTDRAVGRVLEALGLNGFENNTIVIFTSDNGPETYAYPRIKNYGHYSMGDWRGLKRDLWEGGTRVPFIVRYPGVIKPSTVSNQLICQTDILATVASFTEATIPAGAAEDSFDMSEAMKNESLSENIRESVIYHTINGNFAIRKGPWVLIESITGEVSKEPEWRKAEYGSDTGSGEMVLYNLESDPGQKENLATLYCQKARELRDLLENIRNNVLKTY
ncbi:MAG: arylsulfatase [Bacteroidales bacterium]|nr:arylsulfatase [Bacteroidales bacterium]